MAFYSPIKFVLKQLNVISITQKQKQDEDVYAYPLVPNILSQYLKNITFLSNSQIESLSAFLFKGCDSLKTIIFENGTKLKNIEAHAFEGIVDTLDGTLNDVIPQ